MNFFISLVQTVRMEFQLLISEFEFEDEYCDPNPFRMTGNLINYYKKRKRTRFTNWI